jgi:phage-related protein
VGENYIKLDINIKSYIIVLMKDVRFVDSSLDDLKKFPAGARREAGFELSNVQSGLQPSNWKPLRTVGAGAGEIRIKDEAGIYRVIYVAKFEEAVYVLHAFEKKTRKTRRTDIDLAKARYKALAGERKRK